MTPGTYLRKRREAAGLTIAEVAAGAMPPPNREAFALRLAEIEADRDKLAGPTIHLLAGVFRFDRMLYHRLADGEDCEGLVCEGCGCSWHDPCMVKARACAWRGKGLCTACEKPVDQTEPALVIHASDPFALTIAALLADLRVGRWDLATRTLASTIEQHRARTPHRHAVDEPGASTAIEIGLQINAWRNQHLDALPQGEPVHV